MQKRAVITLGGAVVLAIITVGLARSWIEQQVASTTTAPETEKAESVKIVVAEIPLRFGDTIRAEHLRLVDWPAEMQPRGAFHSITDLTLDDERRVALRAIEEGEPLRESSISGFGGRASLSSVIDEGMRASTIRVNDIHGVAGFVLPGDRVDIMLTRNLGMDTNSAQTPDKLVTELLLQNVRVLGIDQDANEKRQNPGVAKAITVEVTPDQAQKLVLAQQLGTLSLALRGVADARPEQPARSIRLSDLSIGEANDAVDDEPESKPEPRRVVRQSAPAGPSDPSVRVFRGTNASRVEVPRDRTPSAQTANSFDNRPLSGPANGDPVPLWSNPADN